MMFSIQNKIPTFDRTNLNTLLFRHGYVPESKVALMVSFIILSQF